MTLSAGLEYSDSRLLGITGTEHPFQKDERETVTITVKLVRYVYLIPIVLLLVLLFGLAYRTER